MNALLQAGSTASATTARKAISYQMARVGADYERHCAASLRLAVEHFETSVLLPPILEAAGV